MNICKLTRLPFFGLLLSATVASAAPWGKTPEKVLDQGIACVSDIVYRQTGGKKGVRFAVATLEGMLKSMPEVDKMQEYVDYCFNHKKHLPRKPRQSKEVYSSMLKQASFREFPGILNLLSGFAEPKMYCSKRGLVAGAAAVLGVGVRASYSLCHDSFGARWMAIGGGAQVQFKLLGASFYGYHDRKSVQGYTSSPNYFTYEDHRELNNSLLSNDVVLTMMKYLAIGAAVKYFDPVAKINSTTSWFGDNAPAWWNNYISAPAQKLLLSATFGTAVAAVLSFRSTNIHNTHDRVIGQGYDLSLGGLSQNHGFEHSFTLAPWFKDSKYLRDILMDVNQSTVEVRLNQ